MPRTPSSLVDRQLATLQRPAVLSPRDPAAPSARSETTIQPGFVVAGRFRVECLIGHGGMGQVYRARHLELDSAVAIKVIRPELRSDHGIVERFLEEGRVAAVISSRHVARVLDAGHLQDRSPFLVLELVDGPDLAAVIARARSRGTTLGPAQCVDHAIDVCEGLAAAHRHGIVHRDIKPSNLLLETRPTGSTCVKVIDFGVAKRIVPRPLNLVTNPRVAVGSPHHMSPEQLLGTHADSSAGPIDARTDIWSFGVVLYELLTGELPFAGADMLEVGTRILESEPVDPSRTNPDVPRELGEFVLRCLRKRREERPGDAGLLAFELRQIRARLDAASALRPRTSAGAPAASRRSLFRHHAGARPPAHGELDRTVPCSRAVMRDPKPLAVPSWGPTTRPQAVPMLVVQSLVAAFAFVLAAVATTLMLSR